jgi:hypothetical protein
LATGNEVSQQGGITIESRVLVIITDPKIFPIIFELGLTGVMDLLM